MFALGAVRGRMRPLLLWEILDVSANCFASGVCVGWPQPRPLALGTPKSQVRLDSERVQRYRAAIALLRSYRASPAAASCRPGDSPVVVGIRRYALCLCRHSCDIRCRSAKFVSPIQQRVGFTCDVDLLCSPNPAVDLVASLRGVATKSAAHANTARGGQKKPDGCASDQLDKYK